LLGSVFFDFRSESAGPAFSLLEDVPNAIIVSLITIPVNILVINCATAGLGWLEDWGFRARYPFLAADIYRRGAQQRRLVALGDAELAKELEKAVASTQGVAAGGKTLGVSVSPSGSSSLGGAGDVEREEGGLESPSCEVLEGGKEEDNHQGAAQTVSFLLMQPSVDILLETAAAAVVQGGVDDDLKEGGLASSAPPTMEEKAAAVKKKKSALPDSLSSSPRFFSTTPTSTQTKPHPQGCLCCGLVVAPRRPRAVEPIITSPAVSLEVTAALDENKKKTALALEAAERALKAAEGHFKMVEVECRALAEKNSLCSLARTLALPLTTLLACVVIFFCGLFFCWYMLVFAKVHGDGVTCAWLLQWLITQVFQHAIIAPLVPYAGTVYTFCVAPSLGWATLGGKGSEESSRNRIMTQAAALGSQLPPSLAFFGYAFALAAGRATMNVNEQVVLAIAAQLKDAGTAALEEKVAAEEEKLAQGCAPRLSPDELHLIVVQAPAVAKVMEAIEISDATRTEMAASVNDSLAPALSLTRLGNREAHTMAVEERIQKRHDAAKAVAEKVQRRHEALNYLEHFYGDNSIPRAQIDGAGDLVISGSASALDAPTLFSHPQAEDIDDANKYQPTFLGGKDKARRASAAEKRIKKRHEAAHHLPGLHPAK